MIKIQNNTATREPLPKFLRGLRPESLLDLSWTDPALGVQDCAWWPEENGDGELPAGHRWGDEILTPDPERQVVVVTHEVVPMSEEEISAVVEAGKAELKEAATAKRWEVLTGGITLPNGVEIATGDADFNRIDMVVSNAALAGLTDESVIDFKAASGWVTLTIGELKSIVVMMGAHMQACFSAERAHHEAIDQLATPAEVTTYDVNAGWPGKER